MKEAEVFCLTHRVRLIDKGLRMVHPGWNYSECDLLVFDLREEKFYSRKRRSVAFTKDGYPQGGMPSEGDV